MPKTEYVIDVFSGKHLIITSSTIFRQAIMVRSYHHPVTVLHLAMAHLNFSQEMALAVEIIAIIVINHVFASHRRVIR